MNRGTDLEANYVAQPDSIHEGLGPVYVSVETIGRTYLYTARDLNPQPAD